MKEPLILDSLIELGLENQGRPKPCIGIVCNRQGLNQLEDLTGGPLSSTFIPFSTLYGISIYYKTDQKEGVGIGTGNLNDTYEGAFSVKNANFYLANSGVRDFFVESEVYLLLGTLKDFHS